MGHHSSIGPGLPNAFHHLAADSSLRKQTPCGAAQVHGLVGLLL